MPFDFELTVLTEIPKSCPVASSFPETTVSGRVLHAPGSWLLRVHVWSVPGVSLLFIEDAPFGAPTQSCLVVPSKSKLNPKWSESKVAPFESGSRWDVDKTIGYCSS